MSTVLDHELAWEAKRLKLRASCAASNLTAAISSRRLGGGVIVACARPAPTRRSPACMRSSGHELPKDVAAWLYIAGSGNVTVYTGKVEMGQNIRTSLAQQVAEELRVPMESISMTMGDTQLVPWDMGTFGSRTTPTMGPQLRTMAAAAREMLLNVAARPWQVHSAVRSGCRRRQGHESQDKSVAQLGQTDARPKAGEGGREPSRTDAGNPVEGRRPTRSQSRWLGVRNRQASVPLRTSSGRECSMARCFGRRDSGRAWSRSTTARRRSLPSVTVVRDGEFVGVTAPDTWGGRESLAALERAVESAAADFRSRAVCLSQGECG